MSDARPLACVSVSGGKDSTAVALLALADATVAPRFVFADTGNEHELTLDYVHTYLPQALGHPVETVRADFTEDIARKRRWIESGKWAADGVPQAFIDRALAVLQPTGNPFLDLCLQKGRFPSRMAQFCTQHLKRYPLDAWLLERLAEGHAVESWRGVRRDESQNRQHAQPRARTPEGWVVVHPIVEWTAAEVVAYVLAQGVQLNPLYSQGMGRVGCMPCINCSKAELGEIAQRFPHHIDRIREWEGLVSEAAKRGYTSFFTDGALDGETHADTAARLSIDQRVLWARTARGGRQFTLRLEEPAGCASVYGLCE